MGYGMDNSKSMAAQSAASNLNQKEDYTEVSSSITPINPATLFEDGFELSNSIITTEEFKGSFTPDLNSVEFYIYDSNKNLLITEYDFQDYFIAANPNPKQKKNLKTGKVSVQSSTVNLTPKDDILSRGYTNGRLYAIYNFINYELGSSPDVGYYISEISSDRTEIRIKSNDVSTRVMKQTFVDLQRRLSLGTPSTTGTFDEFYISFGKNEYHIGVNVKFDDTFSSNSINTATKDQIIKSGNTVGQTSVLIKLVDALPSKYDISSILYVATKPAESQAYLVEFPYDPFNQDNITYLKGPNSNLKINDFVNNASTYGSKDSLLETKSTGSKDQLLYKLNQKGITLDVSYTTASFNDFVNFSSAKSRVSNFVEKVSRIQAYEADINSITTITGSNPGVTQISESIASLYTKIENEITTFDGFDYYQYYNTASDAYPKTGTVFPLQLLATQSAAAQTWIQASEASASLYDEDNQNWLYYTIPDFIKQNTSNANYLEFVNMIGQSFDEVWLYTKAIAEKSNTTNQLDKGVPLQLADDVITSLGYTGFGNNYNNQDNFIGLIGNDDGSYVPPTGSELINHYIAINGPGGIENYWSDFYSFDPQGYVESLRSTGFPYPIDRVSKEIFKRLYHNMSYLVKKKGTIAGLRQLINIWGIPSTILRINEFGGKNKDESDDYDLWYQRYSYAYSPAPTGTNYASSSIRIPYQPLLRNYIDSHSRLLSTSTITGTGTTLTGATGGGVSANYGIDTQFTVTGGGSGGTLTLTADGGGNITTATLTQGDSGGYNVGSTITITAAQANALNDTAGIGTSIVGGPATFVVANANLGAEQIVPDGLGFRFKTTGFPSSSFGGNYDSQSLFIKKSTNPDTEADFGIILNYTQSIPTPPPAHLGATSNADVDYGEMRFWIKGSQLGGDTALSPPIYLPFFDKGWWNVQLQRDEHPIVSNDLRNTTYTLYAANKIYDGADGNQIGFTGSVSIDVNVGNDPDINGPLKGAGNFLAASSSVNASWNAFSLDLAQYGAGAYVGGWGNTLTTGETGSMGILSDDGGSRTGLPKGIQNAGKNFSGSLQEFRYYSHDISQSVFNDAVMNPESIEGNFITGSESSFDIVNFRAPLGNELEHIFTSSFTTQHIEQVESVHPAITGSSPLTFTGSFYNPFISNPISSPSVITSSYDVTYNANSAGRTYSNTNVETYFLDQPSIGIRNRVSNKIKYSTNLNFGKVLSNRVSIQEDPPISQSYTDNINLLEVAFSPTEEVNDDIIQSLGYGAIQEVIADPRFRSSSDDYYPGLQKISDAYFKKYTNRNQTDYLRLIKYFDNSLFQAIKNYVPARTSVSTGVVIKQHMLERNRYREPQVNIVTTQSYAPFNQPLTAKNLELTGSVNTNQLWDSIKQETYYSSSDVQTFSGGAGGSVNQYNVLEEGGGLFALESDDLDLIAPNAMPVGTTITAANGLLSSNGATVVGTESNGVARNVLPDGSFGTEVIAFLDVTTSILNGEIQVTEIQVSGATIFPSISTTKTTIQSGDLFQILTQSITSLGVTTDVFFRVQDVNNTSIFEADPLESASKDIVLVNANDIQAQGTAIIGFGTNTTQTAPSSGVADVVFQNHAVTIITIDPSDGSEITKNYVACSSAVSTGNLAGSSDQFVLFFAGGSQTAAQKNTNFITAVNSVNGQGSGASTPTITAIVDPNNTAQALLTQIYGGTDGNTTITYGSLIGASIGKPTGVGIAAVGNGYIDNQSIILSPTTATTGIGTGLTVNATTNNSTFNQANINSISNPGGGTVIDYAVGDEFSITNLLPGAGNGRGEVTNINTMLSLTPAAFVGGTSIFKNTFLNALKSVQTPIYVEYDFETSPPAPNGVAVTIEASSSIRGSVYVNTTTYTDQFPPGSILTNQVGIDSNGDAILQTQYLDIHPGENMFINIYSVPNITVDDYQIILGENIIITTALAAQSTTNVNTLLIDNLSDDTIPPVGSLVTGPEVKAGVVTTLGAVQTAGTGYTPSTTQVLATRGAGGGNLTLTVVTNASGNVTTAALSNPGTGYSTNDIVTIVGGDNNATVAISIATPLSVLVTDFDPTNNQVTFNSNQTITDNSKLTFTTNGILNADTIPVSQQGYFTNDVTPLGLDTSWDSTQEQFYDGEYSGSTIVVDDYFREQYNPYKKVKANSIPIAETTITVDTANGGPTVTEDPSNAMGVSNFGTGNELRFAFASAGEQVGVYPGITNLELIPYQTYEVEFTLNFIQGGGTYAGIFYENYGYNNSPYDLYPQIVSLSTGTIISGTNTGYSVNNNVATTPPGTRLPTVATGGTGYPVSSTFIVGTFPKDGAGQILSVTTNGSGVITGVTLVEPGSGYLVDASGNPTVLTINGGFLDPNDPANVAATINAGAGGVVVDIIDVDATGAIQTGGITAVNGGNGLYQLGDVITITGGDGTATFVARGIGSIASNGVELLGSGNKPVNGVDELIKFRFQFLPPLSADTSERGRYGLSFYCLNNAITSTLGTITGLKVTGIGGIYENVEAPIFLTQQDRGYDNQKDYQNMGPKDILGNVIAGSPTIIGSISGPLPTKTKQQIISTTVGTSNGSLSGIAGNGSQGGTGAQFTITTTGTQFTITTVSCDIGGTGYIPGDTITIAAATLTGGALGTVTTDLVFRVTSTGIVKPGIPKNGGTGYTTATNVGTTSTGIGTGLKVDTTAVAGAVTLVSINAASYALPLADNYSTGDSVTITGGNSDATFTILSTKGEIDLIQNTQSVIFNQSDYNPLNNNVNTNRSSSNRYILSYGATQSVPNNFDLVVTASYFPTSPSGTFPELADVPDSNYTMPSSVNARYAGTKLKSLNYNFFTPSGSVGPQVMLPIMPVNRSKNPIGVMVANEFIDGSVTSSFDQTLLGAGSASWEGDSRQNRGESTIDKHPIYMARFENSYEQLNLYDSYQFNIDQLIEVPRENIAGSEITPNSITIDGSNKNKKVVSSVFEPKRKVSVSYLNPKTPAIDYTTMQVGNYDILSGATEFLTVNANAKSRVSGSLRYNYTRGGQLVTSSLTQDQGVIQMVTSSLTIGDPQFEGQLTLNDILGLVSWTISSGGTTSSGTGFPIPTTSFGAGGFPSLSLTSVGGPGTGGAIQIATDPGNGEIVAVSGLNVSGRIVTSGTGYIINELVRAQVGSFTETVEIFFRVTVNEINTNTRLKTFNGFLLSGSLTTGNFPPVGNSKLIPSINLPFSQGTNAENIGTITNVPTLNFAAVLGGVIAQGSGLTVDITTATGTEVTTVSVNNPGSGYQPGDQVVVSAADINDVNRNGNTNTPPFVNASGVIIGPITEDMLGGESSPFKLNYNPSQISSSLVTSSLFPSTVPIEQQLLIGGPQLAVFHMFNTTVSSSLFSVNSTPTDLNQGPTSLLWTTSGSNPASSENYYNWAPESSDCGSYTNTNTAFLLERGDIIRVEGTLNKIEADVSQSINTIQNFTVEELLPFTYTSSFSDALHFSTLKTIALTVVGGEITQNQGGPAINATYTLLPQNPTVTVGQIGFTTDGDGIGGVVTVISNVTSFDSLQFTSIGNGFKPGDRIIFAADGVYSGSPTVTFTLQSSAFDGTAFGSVNTLGFQGKYNGAFSNTNTKGTCDPTFGLDGTTRTFSYEINTAQGTQLLQLDSSSTGSFDNVSGTVTAKIKCTQANGIDEWAFTGGSNIPEGTTFSVPSVTVTDATDGWGNTGTAFQFVMIAGCIRQIAPSNNFTIGVDVGGTAESGSQSGFHNYEKGEVGFIAPTFVRVTPDPTETLIGLPGGEITKMTIRRQIEADDKVMLKNITPPSGSKGVQTQSGQGFLIPNDFSETQKSNALNIINQLKAKNAFNKPSEPGITDSGNSIIVQGSGSDTIINIP